MFDYRARRSDANKAILDLFAATTGLPIGLFEKKVGALAGTFSTASLDNFENYCKLIWSFPGGKAACERDHCYRAEQAFKIESHLACCHAGLWNQALPVVVEGEPRAVLLFGEMRIDDPTKSAIAENRLQQVVKRLSLDPSQEDVLRKAFNQVKLVNLERINELNRKLSPIEAYLFSMIDREQGIEHDLEKVVHELQTRLQGVIARAENLMMEAGTLKAGELRTMTNDLLSSAEALAVVVNNLGDFQRAYRFQPGKLRPLFTEAWRIYSAEARERNISMRINMERIADQEPEIEMSRQHLELAVNNLIHNAIKYSYTGGPGRERFVEVDGCRAGKCYKISITNYGIGILPKEIDELLIFEDGYQGILTNGEYRTGSGKGLAFAKRVIDRHMGRIEVESKQVGDAETSRSSPFLTKFTITLPLRQEPAEACND